MKLHLTKGLLAALLVGFAAVGSTAQADVTVDETNKKLTVTAGGGTYEAPSGLILESVDFSPMTSAGNDVKLTASDSNYLVMNVGGIIGDWSTAGAIASNLTLDGNVGLVASNGGLMLNGSTLTVTNGAELETASVWSKAGTNSSLVIGTGAEVTIWQYGTDGSTYGTNYGNLAVSMDGGTLTFRNDPSGQNYLGSNTTFSGTGNLATSGVALRGTLKAAESKTAALTIESGTVGSTTLEGDMTLVVKGSGTSFASGTTMTVKAGSTLKMEGKDITSTVKLDGADSTLWLRGGSAGSSGSAISVELSGGAGVNHTIKGDQTSVRTAVTGTGDLTLENTSSTFLLKALVNNAGTVTIKGEVELQKESDATTGSFGSSVTKVIVNDGGTTANTLYFNNSLSNDIVLEQSGGEVSLASGSSLTLKEGSSVTAGQMTLGSGSSVTFNNSLGNDLKLVQSGGEVTIGDGSSLALKSGSSVTGGTMTVQAGGELDLTNVTTLNAETLDLAKGATLVLGKDPLQFTGTLKVQDGAIIDISSWGTNVYDFYDVELFSGVTELEFAANADGTPGTGFVQIYFGGGDSVLWPNWLIEHDDAPGSVYAIPEPATATLSLLALAGLAARRRRK